MLFVISILGSTSAKSTLENCLDYGWYNHSKECKSGGNCHICELRPFLKQWRKNTLKTLGDDKHSIDNIIKWVYLPNAVWDIVEEYLITFHKHTRYWAYGIRLIDSPCYICNKKINNKYVLYARACITKRIDGSSYDVGYDADVRMCSRCIIGTFPNFKQIFGKSEKLDKNKYINQFTWLGLGDYDGFHISLYKNRRIKLPTRKI